MILKLCTNFDIAGPGNCLTYYRCEGQTPVETITLFSSYILRILQIHCSAIQVPHGSYKEPGDLNNMHNLSSILNVHT